MNTLSQFGTKGMTMSRLDTLQPSLLNMSLGEQTQLIKDVRYSRNSYAYVPKKSAKTKASMSAKAVLALDKLSPAELLELMATFKEEE